MIRPEREGTRRALEQDFMAAKDKCFRCADWAGLSAPQRAAVRQSFLAVVVAEENLALERDAAG